MSALANKPAKSTTRVLGRYTTPAGARTIYGRYEATDRQTRITDESAAIKGDIFLVEVCPDSDGADAIEALVCDYLETAHRTKQIPMAHTILDAVLGAVA
jgi:hypothetical protein